MRFRIPRTHDTKENEEEWKNDYSDYGRAVFPYTSDAMVSCLFDDVNAEDEKESYVSNVYIYIFFFLSKEKGQYILLKGFDYNKKCFDGK